jgi:hypothetical protein
MEVFVVELNLFAEEERLRLRIRLRWRFKKRGE